MDIKQTLLNAAHPNPAIRNPAEQQLAQAAETHYGPFALALAQELVNEAGDPLSRRLGGLYLKNMLTAKDSALLKAKEDKWVHCDQATKSQIRNNCIQALLSANTTISHTSAQVIASIGAIDIPLQQWPELLPALFRNVSDESVNPNCKVHSLEAMGFMCEAMDPEEVDKQTVDHLLNTIVNALSPDGRPEVKRAAITAMNNSIAFTGANFEVPGERDAIMNAVGSACSFPDVDVRSKAYECLANIAALYYSKLAPYIQKLFSLTLQAISSDVAEVGQQAIEFWSTICDTEAELVEDIENGGLPDGVEYFRIIEQAAAPLVPVLLETLSKQSEDCEEDSWNIAKAGAACIEAIAQTIKDTVVDMVLPYVTTNISSQNWRLREGSIMAFGMILDGPSSAKLSPVVAGALPVLVNCMQDKTPVVRDTCCWVLGRICEFHTNAVSKEILPQMVSALSVALDDKSASVSAQACYALHNMANACEDEADSPSNVLSQFMSVVLEKLLTVVNREDWDVSNLRSVAYEAVNKMVENSAQDMLPLVNQVLVEALNRLEKSFVGSLDHQERMNLQSQLCSLVGVCVQKLPVEQSKLQADRIMQLILQVFNTKGAVAHEDAFLAIGHLSSKLEADFGTRYVAFLMPPLLQGLRNTEEHSVCTVAIGVAGDLCRALGRDIGPYCDDIMRSTLEILQSQTVNREVKPHAISLFADVAMAIEGDFEKYNSVVLEMLGQASGVEITDTSDEDQVEYINTLRESILEAYTGIVQGFKEARKENLVAPAIETIVKFIHRSTSDETCTHSVLKGAVGLIGDLGATYGARMHAIFADPYVMQLLQNSRMYEDLTEIANWTLKIVLQVRSGKH